MIARRFRRFAVPLVVAAAGLGLTGCSNRSTDAATVTFHDSLGDHTEHISMSDFTSEIDSLVSNAQFSKLLAGSGQYPELNGKTSTDPGLTSRWLTTLIEQKAIDAEAKADHAFVTSGDSSAAVSAEKSRFSDAVWAAFPKSFQDKVAGREALVAAITRYYETCPSGRFVSHILVKTEAEANAALASIQSGAKTFDAVAKATSIDTASGKAGGVLGCVTPSEFVAPFQAAADTAPLDTLTGPVKTQFGYHLIIVRKWDPVADRTYVQALSQAANAVLSTRIQTMKVWVNPRYGTWGVQTDAQGNKGVAVLPPASPDPRVCREAGAACAATTTTTTTVPAAAGG